MNFAQVDNDEDSCLQVDPKTPVLYGCSMCDFKTNSVEDLKLHLTDAHVDFKSETHMEAPHRETIIQEKQYETFKNEESFLTNEQVHVKIEEDLEENLLIAIDKDNTETEAKFEEFHTPLTLENFEDSTIYDHTLSMKVENALQVEFHVDKKEPPNEFQSENQQKGEIRFKCTRCPGSFALASDLKIHAYRAHNREKPFECPQCPLKCSNPSELKIHIRRHTGEKPFKCVQCEKSYFTSSELYRHLQTHTKKPFECTQCPMKCSTPSELKIHLRRHTGEKRFKCLHCPYSCNNSSNLKDHERTHTKPFKCLECQKSFAKSSELKRHLQTHVEKPFKCLICSKSFAESGGLNRHIQFHTGERTHMGEKHFNCSQCQTCFADYSELKSHLQICDIIPQDALRHHVIRLCSQNFTDCSVNSAAAK